MANLTILAALKAQVQYPLPADFFASVMVERGLAGDAPCTRDVFASKSFKGAKADCIRQLILYPSSITEGGMTISKAAEDALRKEANRLYRQIGEEPLDDNKPRIRYL